MEIADLKFLHDNISNYHTAMHGYVRNVDKATLLEYERIYKLYLNDRFVLTYWCSACVLDMIKKIYAHYNSYVLFNKPEPEPVITAGVEVSVDVNAEQNVSEVSESVPTIGEPKKRGRKPKN